MTPEETAVVVLVLAWEEAGIEGNGYSEARVLLKILLRTSETLLALSEKLVKAAKAKTN